MATSGPVGGILGKICFIVPGLSLIPVLSAIFLASHPPVWILGAAAGAGAAVPAVALSAASKLIPASWKRVGTERAQKTRWVVYALLGGATAATVGLHLVLVLLVCGLAEIAIRAPGRPKSSGVANGFFPAAAIHTVIVGGFGALAWVALKVGALAYGGGFVIVPLMQHDAVKHIPQDDRGFSS